MENQTRNSSGLTPEFGEWSGTSAEIAAEQSGTSATASDSTESMLLAPGGAPALSDPCGTTVGLSAPSVLSGIFSPQEFGQGNICTGNLLDAGVPPLGHHLHRNSAEESLPGKGPFDPAQLAWLSAGYLFDAPPKVTKYVETHFRQTLSEAVWKVMSEMHPRPRTDTLMPQKVDCYHLAW